MENNKFLCDYGCTKTFINSNTKNRHEMSSCPIRKIQLETQKNELQQLTDKVKLLELNNEKLNEFKMTNIKLQEANFYLTKENEKLNEFKMTNIKLQEANFYLTKENEKLTGELFFARNKIDEMSTKILDKSFEFNSELVKTNADMSNKSMSTVKTITKYITKAPVLKMDKKEKQEICGYLENSGTGDQLPAEYFIKRYLKKKLSFTVAIIIGKVYSKEKLEEQAVWATDTSRCSYIIGQAIGDTNKSEWFTDKSGINLTNLVINPALKILDNMMKDYLKDAMKRASNAKNMTYATELAELNQGANDIRIAIKVESLQKEILKHLAPLLGADKTKLQAYFKKFTTNKKGDCSESAFDVDDLHQSSDLINGNSVKKHKYGNDNVDKYDIFKKINKSTKLSDKSNDSKYDFIYSGMFDDSDETNKVIDIKSVKKKKNN
jgi:hypothetical protein